MNYPNLVCTVLYSSTVIAPHETSVKSYMGHLTWHTKNNWPFLLVGSPACELHI